MTIIGTDKKGIILRNNGAIIAIDKGKDVNPLLR